MNTSRKEPSNRRQTQAERRKITRKKIIHSASQLFGARGFENTSISHIAADTGMTEGAIFHHYGNKLRLFSAVTEHQEMILVERIMALDPIKETNDLEQIWEVFLDTCNQKEFVQIVLVDSPHILGRERWQETSVIKLIERLILNSVTMHNMQLTELDKQLLIRMLTAALAEAALTIARNPDYDANLLFKKVIQFFEATKESLS